MDNLHFLKEDMCLHITCAKVTPRTCGTKKVNVNYDCMDYNCSNHQPDCSNAEPYEYIKDMFKLSGEWVHPDITPSVIGKQEKGLSLYDEEPYSFITHKGISWEPCKRITYIF
jgi:hypothetical protein